MTCRCEELRQAVTELVEHCGDHDKTIMDMCCQILELSNIISELKSRCTGDIHEMVQEDTEPTSQSTGMPDNLLTGSNDSLQCGQTTTAKSPPNDSSMFNKSFADISLTDMLRNSTPIHRYRAIPKTPPYQQGSGSIILHKRRTCAIQTNHSDELRQLTSSQKPRTSPQKTLVAIVGSSMVRGLGHMVSDTDIDACCYTNPGAKTDHIVGRIG